MITPLVLRPYQQTLVNNVIDVIERGDKSTLVIASTGSGKTVCMIRIAELLLEKANDNEVVLILSHLSLLTIQTKKKFNKFSSLPIGVLQASKVPLNTDRVIISTMQSSRDFAKIATYYDLSKKKVRYIITDESHFRHSSSYKEIYDTFPDAQQIDVTATPFLKGRLATSIYTSIAYQISLQEMIDSKYLVPPILRQMIIENDSSEKKCAIFMKTYLEYERGKKAVMYMRSKDECKLICDALIREGVSAAVVTDSVGAKQRDEIFEGYDGDKYDVLVSVNVLTAGWDSLKCEAVFTLGTSSPTVYMQRIGRALRPEDGDSLKDHHSKQNARCYVFGLLPDIETGEIEKVHNATVKPKQYSECKTLDEQIDWLKLAEMTHTEEYSLCIASVKVQRLAKKINLSTLLSLINEKAIPCRFMEKLASGADTFKASLSGDSLASTNQLNELRKIGINPAPNLNANEASLIIHSLTGQSVNHHNSQKYVLTEGKFKGQHLKDIPFAYKSLVRRKYPGSALAKLIREFHPRIK